MAERFRSTEATGFRAYLCNPYFPGRGVGESASRLFGQFFPKRAELANETDD